MTKGKNYYLFGHFFLIFSFYTAYILRNNNFDFIDSVYFPDDQNLPIFLLIIITCISTDIGGYVIGNIFKGPKLTKISPNKTYSGMIGGYLFSIIIVSFFLKYYGTIVYYWSSLWSPFSVEFNLNTFICVILISSISQVGDIIISYFKRLSKIKDTGKIIPGHGGLLDRIDGMIFAYPFAYLIFNINLFQYF